MHLTFARRAYELADWYRARGAVVVLRAVLPYLAMSYLYKRSNFLWRQLIRYRLTAAVWRPIVEATRLRHLKFRRRLMARSPAPSPGAVVSAGV